MSPKNQKLLFFIGMGRGGSHAMMQWIQDQFVGMNHYDNRVQSLAKFGARKVKQRKMLLDKKALVKLKYAPLSLSDKFARTCQQKYGTSYKIILGIRDPLNWLASLLKHHANMGRDDLHREVYKFTEFYKEIMREFLALDNVVKNKVTFNYNRWTYDLEYRKLKSKELGGDKFSDKMMSVVARDPGVEGSSFDGSKYQGKAQEMKVFDRYKYLLNNDVHGVFKHIDDELISMSSRVFSGTPIYANQDKLLSFVSQMRKQ